MSTDLDIFLQEMIDKMHEETREAYGDGAFQRWKNRRFLGRLENPDGHAVIRGGCGDSMAVYLKFENDKVETASFETDGCGSSVVCGSFAVELAHGKTPDELIEITPDMIREMAGGLPEEDNHCADLAISALQEALNHYMLNQTGRDSQ
jgi:nitrogen fixation NifU-like protein